MYNTQHFSTDNGTTSVRWDGSADGITVDDENVSFDWDGVEIVTIDNPPHAEAFDSKRFYKLPGTVAKPIPQPYRHADSTLWLKKPREELKRAAWSLDNAPWTLGHPETGMVKDVDDIHGFWSNPRYIDRLDDLDADLHVPVEDDEAREFIEDNGDVSVGFYNSVARVDEYDGVVGGYGPDVGTNQKGESLAVGGTDDEDVEIDGYQTNMLFDHCASVETGRCSSEAGCGLDGAPAGQTVALDEGTSSVFTKKDQTKKDSLKSDTVITEQSETGMEASVDSGHSEGDSWYAVAPSETTDDEPKYPINNCSDVSDAWKLRGHGDIDISQDTLEERIRSRASDLGCEVPGTEDSGCGCDDDTQLMDFSIDTEDLAADAVLSKLAERHDGVDERLDELRASADEAQHARDAAEECGLDGTDSLAEYVGGLTDEKERLEQRVDELARPMREQRAEFIAEHTDRFGEEEELLDEDLDELDEKVELVEDLTGADFDEAEPTVDTQTANATADEGAEPTVDTTGYVSSPW